MTARTETKTLIARQIALNEGLVWSKVCSQPKSMARLLTIAENILATVERKANVDWRLEGNQLGRDY